MKDYGRAEGACQNASQRLSSKKVVLEHRGLGPLSMFSDQGARLPSPLKEGSCWP